jgi:predicted transcriptional regulator
MFKYSADILMSMASKTTRAVQKRREIAEDTDWELYQWIKSHPGLSMYEISKGLRWSHGKVYSSIKRLLLEGVIEVKKEIRNGRSVSIITYKKWQEYFTSEELAEMESPEFIEEVDTILKKHRDEAEHSHKQSQ